MRKFTTINGYLTGLLLLCGDSQPAPETFAFRQDKESPEIKNILLNARSLISVHRSTKGDSTIWTLHQFQDLVYTEDADVVYVNETWIGSEVLVASLERHLSGCGRLYPKEKTQGKESSTLNKRAYINPNKEKGIHA